MIVTNPFSDLVTEPRKPSVRRPKDAMELRDYLALVDCVGTLQELLGSKVFEYHEGEVVVTTGSTIKHQLGRRPRGYILTYATGSRVFSNSERWTEQLFYLESGSGSITVNFLLF